MRSLSGARGLASRTPLAVDHAPGRVVLAGDLRFDDGAAIWRELAAAGARLPAGGRLDIDVSAAGSIDGAVAALLVSFRASVHQVGGGSEIVGANAQVRRLLELHRAYAPLPVAVRAAGEAAVELARAFGP